jgi:hypothetical protein
MQSASTPRRHPIFAVPACQSSADRAAPAQVHDTGAAGRSLPTPETTSTSLESPIQAAGGHVLRCHLSTLLPVVSSEVMMCRICQRRTHCINPKPAHAQGLSLPGWNLSETQDGAHAAQASGASPLTTIGSAAGDPPQTPSSHLS